MRPEEEEKVQAEGILRSWWSKGELQEIQERFALWIEFRILWDDIYWFIKTASETPYQAVVTLRLIC